MTDFLKALPVQQKLYNLIKKRDLETVMRAKSISRGCFSFIDSTEQQIPRPADKQRRKVFCTGKKHGIKTPLIVNDHGLIIHKTGYKKGWSRHDYDIYKGTHPVISKKVVNVIDLGYLGVEKDFHD